MNNIVAIERLFRSDGPLTVARLTFCLNVQRSIRISDTLDVKR